MKVLLVQSWLGPEGRRSGPPVYPAALACLKAALPGHEVAAFDPNVAADPMAELARLAGDFAPDAVGVSLRNIDSTNTRVNVSYYRPFRAMLETLRRAIKAPLVVGGSGFSMFAERIMADCPAIDCGVFLEGERTFAALLENLGDPAAVPSVYFRRDGEVVFSGRGAPAALDDLPSPDFSVLPVSPYLGSPWGIGVETKRGCSLSCVYCPYGFLNGRQYRAKSPQRVADELETLARLGVTRFTFLDSVFSFPADQAAAVCRAMIERRLPLKWSGWFAERGLTREFLALCRQAGCEAVILSPDGFSDQVLTKLGKHLKKSEILAAFDLLADMGGFEVSYNFFKNPPGQTTAAFVSLLAFVFRARRRLGKRVHFEFNTLRVEPHTALFRLAVAEGVVAPNADLLEPVFYTQPRTAWIESAFNLLLRAVGK